MISTGMEDERFSLAVGCADDAPDEKPMVAGVDDLLSATLDLRHAVDTGIGDSTCECDLENPHDVTLPAAPPDL
jgi:hypothetical protein